jgi:hypothetical protein
MPTEEDVMATKRETVEAAARGEGCLGKAADEEPVFVLRAHDRVAPAAVRDWAERARRLGVHHDKVSTAMDLALEMENWRREHGFKDQD